MHNKSYKKIIVFALVLTMLMPLGSMAASSTADEVDNGTAVGAADDTNADDANTDDEDDDDNEAAAKIELEDAISDDDAIALETCEQVADNDKFILYADSDNERIALYVKETNKYWWTSPINAKADDTVIDVNNGNTMKKDKRNQAASSAAIKVADLSKRAESPAPVYSVRAKKTWKNEANGVAVTYKYISEGVTFTTHYELCDDNLYVYVDSNEINETKTDALTGKSLTKLQICPYFGAAPSKDEDGKATEGYMIVPDGSGAVINYNNGKSNYTEYSQQVYGRDYTAVPLVAPRVTEQAYMPVVATVSGKSGLVSVVSDGDANVYAKAQVSGQNKQAYNNAYFEFEVRSQDAFFMSGDNSNKITVFEKGSIKTERFGIRYYPIDKDEDVNAADCAEVYRNYLIENKGLTAKTEANTSDLYLDMFGGVLKRTSIVGLPFNLKTEITGFSQAKNIVDSFEENGISNIVVNYNDWTNSSIKNKISTDYNPSGTLGGSSDMEALTGTDGVDVFPSMNNFQMDSSSWGYNTLTNTAIRVSNAYSRQSKYSPAFGLPLKGVAPALLTPNSYDRVFDQMIESYKDNSITNIGFGDYSTKLVSDFSSKNSSGRTASMNTVVEGYKKASENIDNVLCDGANAYVIPYADQITKVPVTSSGYNVTDYDIPFYQMVIHGYVPYSSEAINASSDTGETFMLALASGSALHYDMTYAESATIYDTDYDNLYYTHYEGWLDMATKQQEIANDVLAGVSDMTISKYVVSDDGNVMTTTYSKDGKNVVVEVNKTAKTVSVDGKVYDLGDAMEGGNIG